MEDNQKVYIRGDSKRYKEVIEILEDLGGTNYHNLLGNKENLYYFISPESRIEYVNSYNHVLYSFIKEFYKEIRLPEEKSLNWKPKYGERYYYINDSDIIDAAIWYDSTTDKCHYNIGNCFKYRDGSIRTILEMLGNVFANKKKNE